MNSRTALCLIASGLCGVGAAVEPDPAQPPGPTPRATIGVVAMPGEDGAKMAASLAEAAAAANMKVQQPPAATAAQGQAAACLWLIEQKVRLVVVYPQQESGFDEPLRASLRTNIPLLTVGKPITTQHIELRSTPVLADFEQQGTLAGKWVLKQLEGTGGVLEIRGDEGSTPSIERQQGFMTVIGRNRGLTLLGSLGQGPTDETLTKRLQEVLEKKGDKLKAIFAHDARGARLACKLLDDSELASKATIKIIAVDSGEGLTGIFVSGRQGASVECEPNAAKVIITAIERSLLGDPIPTQLPLHSVVIERGENPAASPPSHPSPPSLPAPHQPDTPTPK